jgi:hypothetical protein
MKRYLWHFVYLVLLAVVSYLYAYHEIAFKRPQSVHKWRQSDCASIALNYYQSGMKFFQPETHNLTSDGGTSGKASTSEIPVLYYSVAALYKVFGYNESIYRILNTLLFFIGLFYLFRLFKYLLDDGFWAISLALLFFTAPVIVFYGNNFLSNSSSFALSIVGWYYFIRFYKEASQKWFTIAILIFFIAAAFKVTAFFSLFAIGGIYVVENLRICEFKKNGKIFDRPIGQLVLMAASVGIVIAWIIYARYYNRIHDCFYFSTTIFPIWEIDKTEIINVLQNIRKIWLAHYFHISVLLFFVVCFLFVTVFYKKNLKLLNFVLAIVFIEVIVYVLLQFWTFKDHDYYTIDMYIFPVLLIVSTFYILKTSFHKIFSSLVTKTIFALFVIFNVYYAQKMNAERYEGWMNNLGELDDTYTVTSYLRTLGISEMDTIISIPDNSHVSLYLMNQKGWTEYKDARFNREAPIRYNRDSVGIRKSMDHGARYLIVNGVGQLYEKPFLQSFATHLKGRYNNILIFDLKENQSNFNLQNRIVKNVFLCGAETLVESGKAFLGENDSTLFGNGETQSSDFSFTGSHSCKLAKDIPYGLTLRLPDLQFGESFQVSVWRKQSLKGKIIMSATDYYNSEFEVVETRNDGWEKLLLKLFVTKELEDKELAVYLFNPEEEPVYFDDFEIIRFESVLEQ